MAIAIVEDEQKLARSLKEGLVWEGYETDTYPDGESLQKYMEHDAASYE